MRLYVVISVYRLDAAYYLVVTHVDVIMLDIIRYSAW